MCFAPSDSKRRPLNSAASRFPILKLAAALFGRRNIEIGDRNIRRMFPDQLIRRLDDLSPVLIHERNLAGRGANARSYRPAKGSRRWRSRDFIAYIVLAALIDVDGGGMDEVV